MLSITLCFQGNHEEQFKKFMSIMAGGTEFGLFDTLTETSEKSTFVRITNLTIENIDYAKHVDKNEDGGITMINENRARREF